MLSLAAYNAGAGTVDKLSALNKELDGKYWDLFPHETMQYVPKLKAIATIINDEVRRYCRKFIQTWRRYSWNSRLAYPSLPVVGCQPVRAGRAKPPAKRQSRPAVKRFSCLKKLIRR